MVALDARIPEEILHTNSAMATGSKTIVVLIAVSSEKTKLIPGLIQSLLLSTAPRVRVAPVLSLAAGSGASSPGVSALSTCACPVTGPRAGRHSFASCSKGGKTGRGKGINAEHAVLAVLMPIVSIHCMNRAGSYEVVVDQLPLTCTVNRPTTQKLHLTLSVQTLVANSQNVSGIKTEIAHEIWAVRQGLGIPCTHQQVRAHLKDKSGKYACVNRITDTEYWKQKFTVWILTADQSTREWITDLGFLVGSKKNKYQPFHVYVHSVAVTIELRESPRALHKQVMRMYTHTQTHTHICTYISTCISTCAYGPARETTV